MKNMLLVLALLMHMSETVCSQTTINNFAFMQGNWIGVLEYTDYQDDKSKVQLKTAVSYALQFDKVRLWICARPPQSETYLKDFVITAFEDEKLSGTFYS